MMRRRRRRRIIIFLKTFYFCLFLVGVIYSYVKIKVLKNMKLAERWRRNWERDEEEKTEGWRKWNFLFLDFKFWWLSFFLISSLCTFGLLVLVYPFSHLSSLNTNKHVFINSHFAACDSVCHQSIFVTEVNKRD